MAHGQEYHKLVKWGFVIHVNGYSRLVTFAEKSTNNEAITVLNHFLSAVETFGRPLRGTVRTDHGVSLPLYPSGHSKVFQQESKTINGKKFYFNHFACVFDFLSVSNIRYLDTHLCTHIIYKLLHGSACAIFIIYSWRRIVRSVRSKISASIEVH